MKYRQYSRISTLRRDYGDWRYQRLSEDLKIQLRLHFPDLRRTLTCPQLQEER